jgi:hypothetical protein
MNTLVRNIALIVCVAVASACSSGGPRGARPEQVGTLSMPLSTVANGSTYVLTNASVQVTSYGTCCGPIATLSSGADPGTRTLSIALPTGHYTATLNTCYYYYPYNCWTLDRIDAQGNLQPVVATLQSSASQDFTIDNGTTTTITYTFETDGVIVKIGSGMLDVAIAVNQPDAACTPLGTDCGPGSWCPPATLTGQDLVCVPSGAVAIGQPCATVGDCVANASCFDLGAGPVCTALCSAANLGAACDSGGACQSTPGGLDYGICVPTAADAGGGISPAPSPEAGP